MAEKSLDDRIKEAELSKLKSEDEKLKEETALVRKQLNAKWYSGKSLAQITALVLTVVAVYTAIDQIFLAELKQKEARLAKVETKLFRAEVDSLNRAKERITTTIDSLFLRSKGLSLVASEVFKYALKQYKMIKKEGYYDRRLNPDGKGRENKFEIRVVEGDTIIYDAATDLTWQGGKEFPGRSWESAKAYVDTLSYAGGGWRLPTLKEAMSLMEPTRRGSLHIDARFEDTQSIWTVDQYDASRAWSVSFSVGSWITISSLSGHYHEVSDDSFSVRAVR